MLPFAVGPRMANKLLLTVLILFEKSTFEVNGKGVVMKVREIS